MCEDAFTELKAALTEGIAALRSGRELVRHRFEVADPPIYTGRDVQRLRARFGASQTVFSAMLGVSPSAVRAWEQGRKSPSPLARRLLQLVEQDPAGLASRVLLAG